jgi:hypothetical protein
VAKAVLEKVVEVAAKATKVAVREIHHVTTKETVAKEAAIVALFEIHHEAAMSMLESVAREATKVSMCELRRGARGRHTDVRQRRCGRGGTSGRCRRGGSLVDAH